MSFIQRQVAQSFLDTFDTLDLEGALALRAPSCRHTILPFSLGYKPDLTNDQFAEHLSRLIQILSRFPVYAQEIIESGNQITIHATSNAVFRDEVKGEDDGTEWTYEGEYIFVLLFDQSGKIERIVEFIDSAKVAGAMALLGKARENLAKGKEGS